MNNNLEGVTVLDIVKMNEDFLLDFKKDKYICNKNDFYTYFKDIDIDNICEFAETLNINSNQTTESNEVLDVTDAFVSSSGKIKKTKSSILTPEEAYEKFKNSLILKTEFLENNEIDNINSIEKAKVILTKLSKNYNNRVGSAIELGKFFCKVKELCKQKNIKFYDIIEEAKATKFSEKYRYFLISLYKLSEKYPKFKYINIALNFINKYFKHIKNKMEDDRDFWKTDE